MTTIRAKPALRRKPMAAARRANGALAASGHARLQAWHSSPAESHGDRYGRRDRFGVGAPTASVAADACLRASERQAPHMVRLRSGLLRCWPSSAWRGRFFRRRPRPRRWCAVRSAIPGQITGIDDGARPDILTWIVSRFPVGLRALNPRLLTIFSERRWRCATSATNSFPGWRPLRWLLGPGC